MYERRNVKGAKTLRILEELLSDWLGDEAYMLQSPNAWREIIGKNDRIDAIEAWEMECFDNAWSEWFDTENKYALDDKHFLISSSSLIPVLSVSV